MSTRRNSQYRTVGSRYEHILIWERHHGTSLPPGYIVHHADHNKQNNAVCSGPEPCPNWKCGNLHAVTRADHIREHKPGRMGGRKIPNKAGRRVYRCVKCGAEKSRYGDICASCRYGRVGLNSNSGVTS